MNNRTPAAQCAIQECVKPIHARGWCTTHHKRWLTHGDPLTVAPRGFPPAARQACSRIECQELAGDSAVCERHRAQAYRKTHSARRNAYSKTYAAAHPAYAAAWRAAHPEADSRSKRKVRDLSLRTARRSGYIWAGWEMELLNDGTRSAMDLAVHLGRTVGAVDTMRYQMRRDPQTIERAGLSESGTV